MTSIRQGDLLCQTCYEKERQALVFSAIANEEPGREHESMDTDEPMPRKRRPATCSLNQTSDIIFAFEEGGVSSDSESSINNEADETEHLLNQMKAKNLLNDVFAVLGIPAVLDM